MTASATVLLLVLLAFKKTNQNTQEAKNERFLILTKQNNLQIFGIYCL